ncbi:hypothetical protein Tco_0947546 [Tanacetum coccineum]
MITYLKNMEGWKHKDLNSKDFDSISRMALIPPDRTKTCDSSWIIGVSTTSIDFTTANVPVTTAGAEISTASPEVKTASTKQKGNKNKKDWSRRPAPRLQEDFDEEERQRIARVHEAARQLKRLSFDEIKDLFETTMRIVNTFVPIETEIRRGVPKLVADSSQVAVTESTKAGGTKRAAEEELGQQSSKNQKLDELSQEELQQIE